MIFVMLKLVSCKTSESKIDTKVNKQFFLIEGTHNKMNGKVKLIIDSLVWFNSPDASSKLKATNVHFSKSRYNKNGFGFGAAKKYIFDKDGYIIRTKYETGEFCDLVYGENHSLIEIYGHHYAKHGAEKISKDIFHYDSCNGNLKEKISIGALYKDVWNGVDTFSIMRYKYNQLGQCIEMLACYKWNIIFDRWNYSGFDKYGNATQTTQVRKDNDFHKDSTVWHSEFEYDKKGNWIKKVTTLQYSRSMLNILFKKELYKRKIEYYK
jgi:hypothetical protein